MLSVTSGYKTANKSNVVRSNGKISVYDTVVLTTKEFDNSKVGLIEITATTFRNGTIIGNLSMHDIKIEMYGDTSADFTLNTEKHITPSFAMLVSGSYEWLAYQKFIVSSVEYDDTTRMTTIRGADFLWKSNVDFVDTNTYPMSLYDFLVSVGTYCGLDIDNVSIVNGSFSIESKPFPDFTPCSYIISRVAELGGYFARIKKSNNKLEFINAFPSIASPSETLTKDNYFQLWVKEHNFGTNGINTLVMKISQVDGENNAVENATNVAIDGAIEVQIVDNDIVNTETKRLAVIDDIFDVVDGFKFVPCIVDYIGYPYLEVGDTVQVTKMDNSTFVTVITDITLTYDGGLKGQIRGQALNKVQTTYRNYTKAEKRLRNAEINVDKVNNRITLEVSTSIGGQDSILPYTQETWEVGGIGTDGLDFVNTGRLRNIGYVTITPSTDYIIQKSSNVEVAYYEYNSSNTVVGVVGWLTNNETKFTSSSTTVKLRVSFRLNSLESPISKDNMPDYFVRVIPIGKYLKGSKFEVNGEKIIAQTDGFEWKDSLGVTKVFYDTVNSIFTFEGKIVATTGQIGGWDITATSLQTGSYNTSGTRYFGSSGLSISTTFRVSSAGALTCTSGSIGGWSISSSSISKGNTTLSSSGTNGQLEMNGAILESVATNVMRLTGAFNVVGNVTGQQFTTNSILPSANNTYSLGTSSFRWLTIWQQSGSVVGSDLRLKEKIADIDKGVELILNLKPVQYKLKDGQSGRNHYGFIAQEVKEVMTKVGIDDFAGYIDPTVSEKNLDIDGQMLALRYDEFIAPLVKTVQYLYNEIKLLKGEK